MERTDQPYLIPEAPQSLVIDERLEVPRAGEPELSAPRVALHVLLFVATAATATLTGAFWTIQPSSSPETVLGIFTAPLSVLVAETSAGNFAPLTNGLLFTSTLLAILAAHEFGHYFACRYYRIRATLPFFIPAPPVVTPFGTFGAVIKIKEPIRSRRALFDIGIAGPLAGFALALPASVIGLLAATEAAPLDRSAGEGGILFNDPILLILITKLLGLPTWINWNPVYWAAWGALLVTALNLFPVGQLDGGHVVYALTGRRAHKWVSRATCAAVALLAVASMVWHSSPIWIVWVLVLLFLLRVGHPPVHDDEPLGTGRWALAVLAAIVFILCFWPFPITVI